LGTLLLLSAVQLGRAVEPTWEYSVQVSATVQTSPPQITFVWPQDTLGVPNSYTVYRKAPGETAWGAGTTLAGSVTSYVDANVTTGSAFEYQIVKAASTYTGYGYIYAGINAPLVDNRGKVVLIVDNTYAANLAAELNRLEQDLAGDGWTVLRRDVGRADSVVNVKNLIKAEYNADPLNVKGVFLFGRVPVPYSGLLNPDGHPDHYGAWPADVYYGDMDGTWTDNSVDYVQTVNTDPADAARLTNVPGDGKFDQATIPSAVELEVGRVDLANMPGRLTWGGPPSFPTEQELLRQYLNKDHNFRHKLITAPRRGLVGDYFGTRGGEAFAASAFRNFAPFFGAANIDDLNIMYNDTKGVWIPTLSTNTYLWAYGCGAGSYLTIAGLGNTGLYNDGSTTEMVDNDVRAVFTLVFGSWHGDWDHEDNIMRSILATPTCGLACAWSGRPHWFAHHMGLGETIGYAARLTQNNSSGLYQNQINTAAGEIHIALMGDPTLRMHPVAPPGNLSGATNLGNIALSWTPSPDSVLGYNIYRSDNPLGPFTRLTSSLVTGTSYVDPGDLSGTNTYMVRAVNLETTASGTYTNASQGIFWTIGGVVSPPTDTTPPVVSLTDPLNNASLSGSNVTVAANATDNVGVVGVQFNLDGANLGTEVPASPYRVNWDTTAAANGPHTLTAVARDQAGNQSLAPAITVTVTNAEAGTNAADGTVVWFDDALPAGAGPAADGGDGWNWVASNPAPFSGTLAHQSNIAAGLHEHWFNWATATLSVSTGDVLFAYVYVNASNPPSELMLSWAADSWEHRAYWGANLITYGADGSAGRRYMGPLPIAGQWVRLEIPASQVGLEGLTLVGMEFTLYDGGATWDYAGKSASTTPAPTNTTTLPTLTVVATDPDAAETGPDPGVFTITRAGDSTSALTVIYSLAGTAINGSDYNSLGTSVIIPAGAASATVTVTPIDDFLVESNETVLLTLSSNALYTVGAPNNATVTIADNDSAVPLGTNLPPAISAVDYTALQLPKLGDNTLHILSPTLLELHLINTKQPDPATVTQWNFVDANFQFQAPSVSQFAVTVNGQSVAVQAVGFKRRPLYAPNLERDLRIDNCLYLQLASPVADGQLVAVTNPGGALWGANLQYAATADPLRYSPAIHVNQEGYLPSLPKKAAVGYYLGNLGEMAIPASLGFKIVDAATGVQVYQGSLTPRRDVGYSYTPTPYQNVLEADFSGFATPGEYRLVVPGLGASLPFLIDEGVAMAFARAYALGLYHQRCGTNNALPFTRFTHNACHVAQASVPSPQSSFAFTWTTIATYASILNTNNPPQIAPLLTNETAQLYPFVNQGTLDVSDGHHDAGDYSKYTINSAGLLHHLMFAVDSLPGVAALDNLGLPESGDGVSDLMQEAKWEADFLAKMQDADGGFYFLVYPQNREYESNVLPDQGDAQVVWPKTTSVTAASVAALAQCASSPRFQQQYPTAAAGYLQKAQLGWQFLTNAIAKHGKAGAYQKITHYGDDFTHDDELAWAACQMFLATGDPSYHQTLKSWFPDPSDPATFRWGWWRMAECYGHAIRSYAFAVSSGRLSASQLDTNYLSKCQAQVVAAGDDALGWSQENAYGSSFPDATKRVLGAGWYFSSDQAYDITVAYQLNPKPEYLDAILRNMNYEGGCNPVNVTYVTGLGWKRQREIVHQYAQNDRRVLPPSGLPLGNIQAAFAYLNLYGSELGSLCFPQDSAATAPYPFYDRWGDSYNVTTEFVVLNQGRSLASLCFLATLTSLQTQAWNSATAQILAPTNMVPMGTAVTLLLQAPGLDLSTARIVWEARDEEPAYGATFTYSPQNNGVQWVEAEAQLPDGRRLFATANFSADSPNVVWVDDTLPVGASPSADGGDSWNWVSSGPAPYSGAVAQQSNLAAGEHEHYFDGAKATLYVGVGATLFAYVYLDPANPPSEVMLMWNDGTWNHRAYWGAGLITFGADGTPSSRNMGPLPPTGQWVRLEVPASAVALENTTLKGMGFALFGGRATWDYAGKSSPIILSAPPTVTVAATDANAAEANADPGVFTLARTGDTTAPLTVSYTFSGTAVNGVDYQTLANSTTIPAGASSASVTVSPLDDNLTEGDVTVVLTIAPSAAYTLGSPTSATVTIADNDPPPAPPTVTVTATDPSASRIGSDNGVFTIARTGGTTAALLAIYSLGGTALNGTDYGQLSTSATLPIGASAITLTVAPKASTNPVTSETVVLTLTPNAAYAVGSPGSGSITIAGNSVPVSSIRKVPGGGMLITWASVPGKIYRVAYKSSLTDASWTNLSGNITASGAATSWTDSTTAASKQRYYLVYVTN